MKTKLKLAASIIVLFVTLPIITILTGMITEPSTFLVMLGMAGLLALSIADGVAVVTLFTFVDRKYLSPPVKETTETKHETI